MYKSFINNIFYELFIPEKHNKTCFIILPGLPSMPRTIDLINDLTSKGFIVLQPRYIGSWESKGFFSDENCLKTVKSSIKIIQKGTLLDISYNKKIFFKINKIMIIGSSFGASLALSIKNLKGVSGVIAIAPLINFEQEKNSLNFLQNL